MPWLCVKPCPPPKPKCKDTEIVRKVVEAPKCHPKPCVIKFVFCSANKYNEYGGKDCYSPCKIPCHPVKTDVA